MYGCCYILYGHKDGHEEHFIEAENASELLDNLKNIKICLAYPEWHHQWEQRRM